MIKLVLTATLIITSMQASAGVVGDGGSFLTCYRISMFNYLEGLLDQ